MVEEIELADYVRFETKIVEMKGTCGKCGTEITVKAGEIKKCEKCGAFARIPEKDLVKWGKVTKWKDGKPTEMEIEGEKFIPEKMLKYYKRIKEEGRKKVG